MYITLAASKFGMAVIFVSHCPGKTTGVFLSGAGKKKQPSSELSTVW